MHVHDDTRRTRRGETAETRGLVEGGDVVGPRRRFHSRGRSSQPVSAPSTPERKRKTKTNVLQSFRHLQQTGSNTQRKSAATREDRTPRTGGQERIFFIDQTPRAPVLCSLRNIHFFSQISSSRRSQHHVPSSGEAVCSFRPRRGPT